MEPQEFAKLTSFPDIEWHVVTVDAYGPLIRFGCKGHDNLEIHLHLSMDGSRAMAGNVREKSKGRGKGVQGDVFLEANKLEQLLLKLHWCGLQNYHQSLRKLDWRVGGGKNIPNELTKGLGERYQAFGSLPGENQAMYDPVYNWLD